MKKYLINGLILIAALITLPLAVVSYAVMQIPSEKEIRSCMKTHMYGVDLCPGSNQYVRIGQISPYLKRAILICEDASFYQHDGFDWEELKNSFMTNLEKRSFARGGSTLTQQLAKNMFLTQEKSLVRKLKEAVITKQLETVLKKDEIFERYLNVVKFGPNIFGVRQASEFYFKKSPAQLNIVESAFLAFLLPSPDKYSRSYFKKELTPFARKRMGQIIRNLYSVHKISDEERDHSLALLSNFPTSVLAPDVPELSGGTEPTIEELEAEDPQDADMPEIKPETKVQKKMAKREALDEDIPAPEEQPEPNPAENIPTKEDAEP